MNRHLSEHEPGVTYLKLSSPIENFEDLNKTDLP